MLLSDRQIQELKNVIVQSGLDINSFEFEFDGSDIFILHKVETSFSFQIRPTIQGALMADVFCQPYTYRPTIYKSCNTFTDIKVLVSEWATVIRYMLIGQPYYHKVFLSHSSKDKKILNEFVDRILSLGCGLSVNEIVYTSRESTGVEPGDGIPKFIKTQLEQSSLVFFFLSDNYKKSEVCLNEMGAAWAMEKKTVSILLPNVSFTQLGWLTSLDKALKINDSEGLDTIYEMLKRRNLAVSEWNRNKDSFIKSCNL